MDKVYDVSGFRASDNIIVAEYFKKYSEICPPAKDTVVENFFDFIRDVDLLDIGVDFGVLEATCNHENLRLSDEPLNLPMSVPEKVHTKMKFDDYYPINDQARKLNVIIAKEILEKRWTAQEFKFHGKRFIKDKEPIVSAPFKKQNNVKPGSDFVFSILIYKPRTIHQGQRHSAEKLRFAYEIEALGSNFLSQVIDAIECISNSAIIKEVENTSVDLSQFENAKKWYPSQTVFIDGVFYNDTRMPECIDLSPEVIKWAKEKNIGKFTTAKMQETLLSSLSPRLGFPYVYIHQGDCEHIFVFSDVRLVQNGDCLDTHEYPKVVSYNRASNILCLLCTIRVCRWMVSECDRFPQERVFLCTDCCDSYLYVDGKKVTDFKLYPYYDQKKTKN